ncbi:HpcH/HpaI aldolase/citrate lyase family protein (plasmid) [Rhodococcoides fascians]|uniref:HpcH/HpaI aldolase/citrate lyase family protein n=1 Tax=Rhodococcoides fascians TaxID=1828 RepID=UPI00389AE3DA
MLEIVPDAAAIDLEDAVSDDNKTAARTQAHYGVRELAGLRTYVRVNNPSTGRTREDIDAVVQPDLDGIVLPKVEDVETVRAADEWLTAAERAEDVAAGSTRILVLIESALGVADARQILSASSRVEAAIFGAHDFMLDMGINGLDHTASAEELLYARSAVVLASRAARVSPPLDGPYLKFTDDDGFTALCRQARTLGFRGKMLIHPNQVPLSHIGFGPTADDIELARRIVDGFEAAEADGVAATVVDGRLVDYPIADRARKILSEVFALPKASAGSPLDPYARFTVPGRRRQ